MTEVAGRDPRWLSLQARVATDPSGVASELGSNPTWLTEHPHGWAERALLNARLALHAGRYAEVEPLVESIEACDHAGLRADAANLLGTVRLEEARYDEATSAYLRARAAYSELADVVGVARTTNNLGLVFWRIDDFDQAEAAFREALAAFEGLGDPRFIGNVENSLGLVASGRAQHEQALRWYERALARLLGAGDSTFLANVHANIADELNAMAQHDAAYASARIALDLRVSAGHRRGVAGSLLGLARIELGRGRLDEARQHLSEGEALASELGLRKHLADASELASLAAAMAGDGVGAIRLLGASDRKRRALAADQVRSRLAGLRTGLELAQARRERDAQERENRQLAVARDEAEAANRAKSDFVATISHEIRTPIAAILGAAELLEPRAFDAEAATLVRAIRASCTTLLAVAEDVLDFAAIEAGRVEVHVEPFDLSMLLQDLGAYASERAARRGLRFRLDLGSLHSPSRLGAPGRIRQVLVNLLSNALKFTDSGEVCLAAAEDPKGVRIEVHDTGPGLSPEAVARLFQPFVQIDSSTRRRHGGTGLGLVIARRLSERMGGVIEVESQPGLGSTFRCVLPLAVVARPELHGGEAPRADRVLLVEDDEGLATLLAANLRRLGLVVERASNGAAAVECMAGSSFDAVVLDVHMPEMDGFETAAHLRAAVGPGLAIVGLTGAATAEDRARGLEAGMDAYLYKPVTTAQVLAAVRGAVAEARARRKEDGVRDGEGTGGAGGG